MFIKTYIYRIKFIKSFKKQLRKKKKRIKNKNIKVKNKKKITFLININVL